MSSYTEFVFVDKFGWGEDWQADHSQVVELIDITHLTMGVIHLLMTILRSSGLSMKKIFDFLNEQVLPSKVFKMNSKMFTNLYVKCFENKKVRVNLYGDEFWERQFLNLMTLKIGIKRGVIWVLEGPPHQSRTSQVDLF